MFDGLYFSSFIRPSKIAARLAPYCIGGLWFRVNGSSLSVCKRVSRILWLKGQGSLTRHMDAGSNVAVGPVVVQLALKAFCFRNVKIPVLSKSCQPLFVQQRPGL